MRHLPITLLIVLLLAACQNDATAPAPTSVGSAVTSTAAAPEATTSDPVEEPAETATPAAAPTQLPPTPTPLPAKELVVCISGEPTSLYVYGDDSLAATAVRHALYENLYTTLGYDYQPQALLKLPSLHDGDAVIQTVNVAEGDLIVNAAGKVTPLLPGAQIVNAEGKFIIYQPPNEDGPPVQMQQMVAEFAFHPLVWSDGTPVTADDSVFSFQLAADPATPGDKAKVERTARYEAIGAQSVRWTGLPGFLDPTYFTNVWPPLPRHQLAGLTAEALLTAEETNHQPLASGPFQLEAWQPGEQIILSRNPYYYRQAAGMPVIDRLVIKTSLLADAWPDMVTSGQCDVVTRGLVDSGHVADVLAAVEAGTMQAYFPADIVFEHLDFGINSWGYGDDVFNGRPDWFDFVPVRQAVAQCINRQRLSDELFSGQAQVMDAYIPQDHPLFPEEATIWSYDPAAANALLQDFGLEDTNGDGWREWVERDLQKTIVATTTFSITLGANSESSLRLRVNELVQDDLAHCGIRVNLYDVPAEIWYDDGPFSPLFGRRFDLATFAWRIDHRPACSLYLSANITGPEELGFGGWGNVNATGWGSEAYDAACQAALDTLPGTEAYETNHKEAVRLFTERLPSLPLFQYVKTAVTGPAVRNFKPDSTQPSELWNVYEWDIEE